MKNNKIMWILGGAALILVLFFVVRSFWDPNLRETKEGVAWLKELEAKDMDETESKIKKVKRDAQTVLHLQLLLPGHQDRKSVV